MQVVTSKVCPAWILYFSPFLSGRVRVCACAREEPGLELPIYLCCRMYNVP